MGEMTTYRLVRCYFDHPNAEIATGLTLKEAQEHCNREDTHGEGWFDAYYEES